MNWPTGSTGYNLSAGGPIISVHTQAICVTPICAHSIHSRPIVLSDREELLICVQDASDMCRLFIDGQIPSEISVNDQVRVTRAEVDFKLLEVTKHGRYGLMRDKLGWV